MADFEVAVRECIQGYGVIELMKILDESTIDVKLNTGWTPLMYACSYAKDSIVDYLLRKGADANHECEFFTPIMAVCNSSSYDKEKLANCARSLIQHGANVNSLDKCKTTPLMFACVRGHQNLVSILCDKKCDVNRFDNDGYSALHLACSGSHFDIVQTLMEYGADKYARDRRGRLPLDIAISKGADDIIQLLDDHQHVPIENETSISYKKQKSSFEELLLQLPDHNSNGQDGFHKDVEILLDGMRLGQKADLFLGKGISLAKFLNITNVELKKLGLYFSSHRERVLEGNKRFVMHPWGAGSLPGLNGNNLKPVQIMDIVRSLANLVRQLHIVWATTLYCDERIIVTAEDPKVEDLYQIILQTYKQTKSLMKELNSVLEHVEKLENEDKVQHVDLILPKKPRSSLVRKVLFLSAFCAVLAWSKRTLVK